MDSISRVLQRINTIEQKFTPRSVNGRDFGATLAAKLEPSVPITLPSANNNTNDTNIAKMINLAAQKYGVDPKLAMAVAKVESDLSPDAVSSAGAVGVMQLMPETAEAIGVRNINDPRENIDGGIHYLQQMLNTFGGDVSKAVAAYNAGPQAVKSYNGIPPYGETRAYVSKVLSLYK